MHAPDIWSRCAGRQRKARDACLMNESSNGGELREALLAHKNIASYFPKLSEFVNLNLKYILKLGVSVSVWNKYVFLTFREM